MDIGVDVGGTFTDLIAIDSDGSVHLAKVPSTTADQSIGFMAGLAEIGVDLGGVRSLVHGSTVAINALLERKGAAIALVTTRGFRDVLELRRRDRPHAFGLRVQYQPLVPRERRFEIAARLDGDGGVLVDSTDQEIKDVTDLAVKSGAEALVVVLFNGHRNPTFEKQVADRFVAAGWPANRITAASDVSQEIREFERSSTVAISAYVQPAMSRYLENLGARLSDSGFDKTLLVSQSNGGAIDWRECARIPVNSIMSGPSAGAIACAHIAREAGFENAIACDIGGTSCDITLVIDGLPAMRREAELDFGLPIRRPMVDVTSIAAGGGSIAELDGGGILRVGPRSAGSRPGPACYGFGGQFATTTDAQLVLGRLAQSMALGTDGSFHLDPAKAGAVVEANVAKPLGLTLAQGATAIIRVTEQNIASAVRRLSTERGYDPRKFALVMFGGAGPTYICSLMRMLSMPAALIPPYPGATSAVGCLLCDLRLDFIQSFNDPLTGSAMAKVTQTWSEQEATARERITKANVVVDDILVSRSIYCCYEGQSHSLEITVATRELDANELRSQFEAVYLERFGRTLDKFRVLITGVQTICQGIRKRRELPRYSGKVGPVSEPRKVWAGQEWCTARIVHRASLASGQKIEGPAIIEQSDTTSWIEPGFIVEVLPSGTLLVRSPEQ